MHCDVISNRLWRHQQNLDIEWNTELMYEYPLIIIHGTHYVCMYCREMHLYLFLFIIILFRSFLRESINKHHDNPPVSILFW